MGFMVSRYVCAFFAVFIVCFVFHAHAQTTHIERNMPGSHSRYSCTCAPTDEVQRTGQCGQNAVIDYGCPGDFPRTFSCTGDGWMPMACPDLKGIPRTEDGTPIDKDMAKMPPYCQDNPESDFCKQYVAKGCLERPGDPACCTCWPNGAYDKPGECYDYADESLEAGGESCTTTYYCSTLGWVEDSKECDTGEIAGLAVEDPAFCTKNPDHELCVQWQELDCSSNPSQKGCCLCWPDGTVNAAGSCYGDRHSIKTADGCTDTYRCADKYDLSSMRIYTKWRKIRSVCPKEDTFEDVGR